MSQKAPGKAHRKGITLLEVATMFHNEEAAKVWLAGQRWLQGPKCPYCSTPNVQSNIKHKTMMYRCRECKKKPMFSLKTGTIMEGSNLKYLAWAVGIYLFTTNIKGISSMKLHRELGIGQKAAWFMLHRLRKALEAAIDPFTGAIEVDETYIGGKEANKHAHKKTKEGRGSVEKQAVVGVKSRETKAITAKVIDPVSAVTLQRFVTTKTEPGTTVYSDQNPGYIGLKYRGYTHESVNHSTKEFVNGQAHTNGIESFWSMLKRGYHGTYHHMSAKHLQRYIEEFAGRHNIRSRDTGDQMACIAKQMQGKRLRYQELVA